VSVAISKAIEFGFDTCRAVDGNLATPSRPRARAGLACYIFIPDDLEQGQGHRSTSTARWSPSGNYDDVNRLCSEIAKVWWVRQHQPAAVLHRGRQDLRLRRSPSKLGWRLRSTSWCRAGGTILPKVAGRSASSSTSGWLPATSRYTPPGGGCAPVVQRCTRARADRARQAGDHRQVDRDRQPGRRYYVLKRCASRWWGEAVTDAEIMKGSAPRAHGGSSRSPPAHDRRVTKKLIEQGRIPRDESIVVSVTGNGYKTSRRSSTGRAAVSHRGRLADFDALYAGLDDGGRRARSNGPVHLVTKGEPHHGSVRIPTPLRRYTGRRGGRGGGEPSPRW